MKAAPGRLRDTAEEIARSTGVRDGAYRGVLHGRYGEPVPLTAPFTGELPTVDLPLYAPRG
ncbi:hypothetical protein [Kitasatospora purpeofusca]|uniref:Uncharacterized protein n=1 Tax=Kitasatospora purpeofusca TaxID=67352 RepID=A0ABZ1U3Y2_9ACTN|nr:hypothetical protein [Kitasatospora purpeofusca]